jgi:hypothetical protein
MRSAKFTAPEKEVEKKTVQLDQNTVNKRIAEFKVARGCLVPKNRPLTLTARNRLHSNCPRTTERALSMVKTIMMAPISARSRGAMVDAVGCERVGHAEFQSISGDDLRLVGHKRPDGDSRRDAVGLRSCRLCTG